MLELLADIEPEPGHPDLESGWRGLIDFGEVWRESDADLWPSVSPGKMPLGEPLTYGCELRRASDETPRRAKALLWAIDSPRRVMSSGAEFRLLDGHTVRARGRLLDMS